MSQKKTSKEERFLQKLNELANGDPEVEVDRYLIGRAMGENTRSTDHSVQMLTKINFIKKTDDNKIHITPLGINFLKQ